MRVPPLGPNQLPKAPPPNTVTLGVSISSYELGGHTFSPSQFSQVEQRLLRVLRVLSAGRIENQSPGDVGAFHRQLNWESWPVSPVPAFPSEVLQLQQLDPKDRWFNSLNLLPLSLIPGLSEFLCISRKQAPFEGRRVELKSKIILCFEQQCWQGSSQTGIASFLQE